jgi:hypothetical protein
MASDKALYWIAVVVLALGFSNSLVNAHPDWAQAVAEQPLMLADAACSRLTNLATVADLMFGHSQVDVARTQAVMARVQGRLASAQARIASRQAQMARTEAQQVRTFTMERMNRMVVICPRQNRETAAPDAPAVQVDDSNDTN